MADGLRWLLAGRPVSLILTDPRGTPPPLPFDEEAAIVGASPPRRAEFAHGRAAARRAVAALGLTATALPMGMDRTPLWPSDIVGSISHCATLCGAVAARKSDLSSIGFDVEIAAPLPFPASAIASSKEIEAFERIGRPPPGTEWPMIAFVAREAFYKCHYPLNGRFLDFRDGRLILVRTATGQRRGEFSVDLDRHISGRWLVTNGHIFALAMTSL